MSLKIKDFVISVTIIEARGLSGSNTNPIFEIYCGKQMKVTEMKMQTNTPFYNEYFTFDLRMSRLEVMQQIIRIRALTKRSHVVTRHIFPGKVIGEFSIDAKTVYSNEDHSFFRKWAVLINPKAPTSGEKSWVKVDISVLCHGDKPKRSLTDVHEENPNIEANLLIPQCVSDEPRKICEMAVLIYQAQDLPCMNTTIVSDIKHAIFGEGKPLADPYVEVSFAGYTARTRTISHSYSPNWNQKIVFTERFPPFVSRLRITVRDQDMVKDETISTVFIDLHKIMYTGSKDEKGFLPTYGPGWINLYGSPRTFSYAELLKGDQGRNHNLAEGVAYRGRLLIGIKTVYQPDSMKIGVDLRSCNPLSDTVAGKSESYLLFATLFEATLINEEFGKKRKPISFEISIGTAGHSLDESLKAKNEKGHESNSIHSVTEPKPVHTFDNKYFHIPYSNQKPCLYVITEGEDQRPRMFVSNLLEKLKVELSEYIRQTNYMLSRDKYAQAKRYLQEVLIEFAISIEKVIAAVKVCRGTAKRTMLDVKYQRLIQLDLEKMKVKLKEIASGLSRKNAPTKLRECRHLMKLLEDRIIAPQHGLPDIFVYMILNNEAVAYARIKSRELLHSVINAEKGRMCGVINTVYLKKMDHSFLPNKGYYNIQAQLQLYLWLGLAKDRHGYIKGLPEGYDKNFSTEEVPPKILNYNKDSVFQMRAYLFMGRNLIGSDDSGLSDPFARIIIGEHVRKSVYIQQTRTPMWDTTIIIDDIRFNYSAHDVKSKPPNIVVEVFDQDNKDEEEFIGRVFCQPTVNIEEDVYISPKLQSWPIYRSTFAAGDIIAAFDLIEMDAYSKRIRVENVIPISELERMTAEINQNVHNEVHEGVLRIPYGIRLSMSTFRFEIIMWGVRQLERIEILPARKHGMIKRMGIFPVNQPRICMEIAGYKIESDRIEDWSAHANFDENLIIFDLKLPRNIYFWPPLLISCSNSSIFGLTQNVGNNVITNMAAYCQDVQSDSSELDMTTVSLVSDPSFNSLDVNKDKRQLINDKKDKKKDTLIDTESRTKSEVSKLPTPGFPEKIMPTISKDELDAADWWTRYYATIKDTNEPGKRQPAVQKYLESESEDELMGDIFKDIEIEIQSNDEEDEVIEIPDDVPKKKKKKKRKKVKIKRNKHMSEKKAKEHFLKEIPEGLTFESELVCDDSWIDRITIYPFELENVKDFGGFHYPFKSFTLYRGKQEEEDDEDLDSSDRFGCVFKGNLCIYPVSHESDEDQEESDENVNLIEERKNKNAKRNEKESKVKGQSRLFKSIVDNSSVDFLVRIYIVRGLNLHPADINGKTDPYLTIRLGPHEIRDRKNYIPKTLNPIFGKMFEIEATFPQESLLVIQVVDWDRFTRDDLIGETKIDLENRWLSPHNGCCGLMPSYHNNGFMKWKDSRMPTDILNNLCEKHNVAHPTYDKITDYVHVGEQSFTANTLIEDDSGSSIKSLEPLALKALQNWSEIVPDCKLVPEHIETRPLYLQDKPGIEQGLLEMWVDMYRRGSEIPLPIDISPRVPVGYELRIVIFSTEKVRLTDTNFVTKEKSADIYLKAWMKSMDIDLQETDIHYRSLSGQGLFNWRFVFKFDYLKAEDCIVYKKKKIYEIDETEFRTPCYLNMQVLDSNILFSDQILGKLKFRLSKFPKPAKFYKSCHTFQHSEACAKFNLFRNKKVRGWWPLIYNPKDEDSEKTEREEIGGNVEMEMELLLSEAADSNPVGLGRDEPMPLEKPNRPDGSFLNFLNPWKTIKYFIKYRLKWILIKLLIIAIFILILVLFVYNFPGNFSRVIVDKVTG